MGEGGFTLGLSVPSLVHTAPGFTPVESPTWCVFQIRLCTACGNQDLEEDEGSPLPSPLQPPSATPYLSVPELSVQTDKTQVLNRCFVYRTHLVGISHLLYSVPDGF